MKKRIVIDGVIFGLQRAGGISRLWAEILLELDQKLAKECTLFLLIPKNRNVEWEALIPHLKSIKVIKRSRFHWGRRSFFRDCLYLTWIALKLRPTLWHSTYYVGFPYFFSGHKVITCLDMIPEVLGEALDFETKLKYRALKASQTILAISKHTEKDLQKFWPEFKEKTKVHYNYCRALQKGVTKTNPPYFLFVGKRRGYKNFLPTIKAILKDSRFDAFRILVAGGEEKWNGEEFKVVGNEKRVEFVGLVSFETIEKLIQESTILLFPSLYEGFGLPVLEAFSAGVPVLAFNTSSIPEVTGLTYPLADSGTIAETLATLLSDRTKWSAYGKERCNSFTLEKTTGELINFYKSRS